MGQPARAAMLVCLLATAPARADDLRVRLAWVRGPGAETCPDAESLRAAVTRRLGRDVFDPTGPTSVEIGARARENAPGWEAQVFVRGADGALLGQRQLDASTPDCAAFVETVALAVAVTLDADAALRPPRPTPPAPVVVAPPPRPPSPRPALLAAHPWEVWAGIRVGALVAVVPGVSVGVGVVGVARPPGFVPVEAALWYFPDTAQDVLGGSARVGVSGGSLGLCPVELRRASLRAVACVGTFVGRLRAEGEGYRFARVATAPTWSVEFGVRLQWAPRPAWIELSADGLVPIVGRDTLTVDRLGEVFTPAVVGFRTSLGAGVHFE